MLVEFAFFVGGGIIGFLICVLLTANKLQEQEHCAWHQGYNHGFNHALQLKDRATELAEDQKRFELGG